MDKVVMAVKDKVVMGVAEVVVKEVAEKVIKEVVTAVETAVMDKVVMDKVVVKEVVGNDWAVVGSPLAVTVVMIQLDLVEVVGWEKLHLEVA